MNAWPAFRTVVVGGWALRFAGGHTKRANSVNALAPSAPFEDVKATAETLYARQGLPTIFRLSPLAQTEADAILASAGYGMFDPSLVMTAPLTDGASDAAVEIESTPSAEWLEGHAQAGDVAAARRPAHATIVRSIMAPAAFATVRKAACPVGFGLAVYERGMVGLFDVVVAPEARRQGLGRTITEALLGWGYREGARAAYLQVRAANAAALDLYRSLGFAEAYCYHYRIPRG